MAGAVAVMNVYAPIPAFSIVLFPPAATLDHNQTRHILRSSISTYIILCNVTRQKFKRNRQKHLTQTLFGVMSSSLVSISSLLIQYGNLREENRAFLVEISTTSMNEDRH